MRDAKQSGVVIFGRADATGGKDAKAMATSDSAPRNVRRGRAVVYDVTHLTTRLTGDKTTGIDWVDRAYARHFATSEGLVLGLHYGLLSPHLHAQHAVAELSRRHESKFARMDAPQADGGWRQLREWLTGRTEAVASSTPQRLSSDRFGECSDSLALKLRTRIAHDRSLEIPEGAIYLNVAQHGFEYPWLFNWLNERPDVVPIFLAHDLLPLDFPEYFREGYADVFRRRFGLIQRRARGVIATCRRTADRIRKEFRACGAPSPEIHVQPLASPLGAPGRAELHDAGLSQKPYFVIVGTLEPRKNHALLLNVWRDLALEGGETPKLVFVGARGWRGGQTLDVIGRSKILAPHIRHASGLPSQSLRLLLANARALLAPNYAEGYGIPLVDALAVGAPVICSDNPVFREVTQERATFIFPLDGAAWRSTIRQFAEAHSAARESAGRLAGNFNSPNWTEYFSGVEQFLDSF